MNAILGWLFDLAARLTRTLDGWLCAALAASLKATQSRVPTPGSAQYTMGAVRDSACTATPARFIAFSLSRRSQYCASRGGVRAAPT